MPTIAKNQTKVGTRFVMAFAAGMVIPGVIGASGHVMAGALVALAVAGLYATERKDSEARGLGVAVALITAMLLVGSFDTEGALVVPAEIAPAW